MDTIELIILTTFIFWVLLQIVIFAFIKQKENEQKTSKIMNK
jgi:hypothetical protein